MSPMRLCNHLKAIMAESKRRRTEVSSDPAVWMTWLNEIEEDEIVVLQVAGNCATMPLQKIIGGEYASLGEFPYQLSMESESFGGYFGFCGASAISDVWALSAAHCVVEEGTQLISTDSTILRSGSLMKQEGGIVHPVEKIVAHYKYEVDRYDNDIAVLKVKHPFSANPNINYVHLPHQGQELPVGTKLTVIGWGLVNDVDSSSELKKTVIDVVNDKVCANIPHFRQQMQITRDMICAVAEGTDSAPGDSGGPLVLRKGSQHIQVGIVSWGTGTGQLNDPGLYSKVSHFRVWIHSKTSV